MLPIIFEEKPFKGEYIGKITLAKNEIRIKVRDMSEESYKNSLILVARELELKKLTKNIDTTIRCRVTKQLSCKMCQKTSL